MYQKRYTQRYIQGHLITISTIMLKERVQFLFAELFLIGLKTKYVARDSINCINLFKLDFLQ